jgi:hypothetical protein
MMSFADEEIVTRTAMILATSSTSATLGIATSPLRL